MYSQLNFDYALEKLSESYQEKNEEMEYWKSKYQLLYETSGTKAEVEKLQEELRRVRSETFLSITPLERKRMRQFQDYHSNKCHYPDNSWHLEILGTGLGDVITIECPVCHTKFDVTDDNKF